MGHGHGKLPVGFVRVTLSLGALFVLPTSGPVSGPLLPFALPGCRAPGSPSPLPEGLWLGLGDSSLRCARLPRCAPARPKPLRSAADGRLTVAPLPLRSRRSRVACAHHVSRPPPSLVRLSVHLRLRLPLVSAVGPSVPPRHRRRPSSGSSSAPVSPPCRLRLRIPFHAVRASAPWLPGVRLLPIRRPGLPVHAPGRGPGVGRPASHCCQLVAASRSPRLLAVAVLSFPPRRFRRLVPDALAPAHPDLVSRLSSYLTSAASLLPGPRRPPCGLVSGARHPPSVTRAFDSYSVLSPARRPVRRPVCLRGSPSQGLPASPFARHPKMSSVRSCAMRPALVRQVGASALAVAPS
jgi:hypothetical protein